MYDENVKYFIDFYSFFGYKKPVESEILVQRIGYNQYIVLETTSN